MRDLLHITVFILSITYSLLFIGCNKNSNRYKVGVSQFDNSEWCFKMNRELAHGASLSDLYDIESVSAGGDSDTQIRQIREFIDTKVDVIVVVPNDYTLVSPIITEARDKDILVLIYSPVDNQLSTLVNNDHIAESNVESEDKVKQQRVLLISISIFTVSLFFVMILLLIFLRRKMQINSKLSAQNDQITQYNMQLEVQRKELIRMSNNLDKGQIQEPQFMDRVNEIINNNLSDPNFGVDRMCEELCYSRVQIYRKVKMLTGESPNKLLRIARVKLGDYLLRNSDKSISDIAYEVGYISPSYFAKYYKELYGILPSEVKR